MRDYKWWKRQKRRVQKKYTLLLGRYLTPKELKKWYKNYRRVINDKRRTKRALREANRNV